MSFKKQQVGGGQNSSLNCSTHIQVKHLAKRSKGKEGAFKETRKLAKLGFHVQTNDEIRRLNSFTVTASKKERREFQNSRTSAAPCCLGGNKTKFGD